MQASFFLNYIMKKEALQAFFIKNHIGLSKFRVHLRKCIFPLFSKHLKALFIFAGGASIGIFKHLDIVADTLKARKFRRL